MSQNRHTADELVQELEHATGHFPDATVTTSAAAPRVIVRLGPDDRGWVKKVAATALAAGWGLLDLSVDAAGDYWTLLLAPADADAVTELSLLGHAPSVE